MTEETDSETSWIFEAHVQIIGGSTYQDRFSLYNKIGWEFYHLGLSERRSGIFRGREVALDSLDSVRLGVLHVQRSHTGEARAKVVVRYHTSGGPQEDDWSLEKEAP